MRVLSLFDGISGARLALDRAGIKVDKYYASEVDKYAIQIAMKNYPDTIQLGDVTKWQEWDIGGIDLLVGGSPCQGFSFAGKQLNFDDPRSALFFQYVQIKNHFKPKYFLLENVKMKKEYQQVITDMLGVEPILINSALVSAQNRNRLYWTNIPGIEQPEDKGILLKDVIEKKPGSEFFYSQKSIDYMERGNDKWMQAGSRRADRYTQTIDTDKSFTLTANMHKGVPYNYFQERPCELREFNPESICHHAATATDIKGKESIKRVYAKTGKAPTLTTMQGGIESQRC